MTPAVPVHDPDLPTLPSGTVAGLITFFETLSPQSIANLKQVYDADARFVDPFNDVQGLGAIEEIFRHMFAALDAPRFIVTGQVVQGPQCFLTWEFHFRFKRFSKDRPQLIRGVTHVVFTHSGLVCLHRDYWDAAQELYEQLPLLGGLMRWLRKRANN